MLTAVVLSLSIFLASSPALSTVFTHTASDGVCIPKTVQLPGCG